MIEVAERLQEFEMEPDDQRDIYIENEELKVWIAFGHGFCQLSFICLLFQEEIQKLAGQVQYLKIVGMLTENRHLKNKQEGYFSKEHYNKTFHQILSQVTVNL